MTYTYSWIMWPICLRCYLALSCHAGFFYLSHLHLFLVENIFVSPKIHDLSNLCMCVQPEKYHLDLDAAAFTKADGIHTYLCQTMLEMLIHPNNRRGSCAVFLLFSWSSNTCLVPNECGRSSNTCQCLFQWQFLALVQHRPLGPSSIVIKCGFSSVLYFEFPLQEHWTETVIWLTIEEGP